MYTAYQHACFMINAYWPYRHDPSARERVRINLLRARAYKGHPRPRRQVRRVRVHTPVRVLH